MTQQRTIHIFILLAILVMGTMPVWGKVQMVNGKTYNVVYMSSAGAGNKSGDDAANAVSGWTNAYNKLSKTGGTYEDDWNYNIIVVVGEMALTIYDTDTNNGVPATITGVWPWDANEKVEPSKITSGGKIILASSPRKYRIGSDTRFKNVYFHSSNAQARLCLFLHNTTFDIGCIMDKMSKLETNMGAMDQTTHMAPMFHLLLFSDENDFTQTTSPVSAPWNQTEPMTLTIKSGRFGRILCTRIAGTNVETQTKRRYVVGTPDMPLMAKIVVDVDSSNDAPGFNPYGYKDDIAFLCAGTTQGAVYADVQMDIKRGKIATVVAGSQGNAIPACETAKLPTSSYYGRTIVNVEGATDSDVTIYRYFGACLGRFTGGEASGECKAYFYGHSTLNLIHGTIEQDIFASAGGLSGLKNPNTGTAYNNQYTNDSYIPYQGGSNNAYPYLGIDYNKYNSDKTIVKVTSKLNGEEEIDLADTKIVTNIRGGIVKGNVYGGSYGYSSEMLVTNAPSGAGSLWGNTEVNISGGEIRGSVYGGGAGAKSYYNLATTDDERAKYLTVATVYGNTNLTITGKPTILGNIYGGGAGLASQAQNATDVINVAGTITYKTDLTANEFLNIARVYGNANVTINADADWNYTGNIYGGGAMGAVEGSTNVQILGGNITGNVYAASAGEAGYPNKGKIGGAPSATIAGGTISQNVYGGGQLAPVEGNPLITLAGGAISQDIYGGGDEAPVKGNPLVEAQFGSVNDIFAGGRGATAVVTGDPKAYINKTDNETLTVRDVYGGGDAANVVGTANVQLDKGTVATIYGGGNAANVTNTDVVINGGQATMAFAGGHGDKDAAPQKEANVTGDAQLTIHGGTVGKAFAGSNSKGSIAGAQTLSINKTGDALAELHVTEAYGGGNQADGKAGTIEVGCTGGETEGVGDLFGGAREANISGNIALTLEAGRIARVFGGNNVSGNVAGTITVDIAEDLEKCAGGLHIGSVYGGGQDAAYSAPAPGTYPVVNIQGGSITNDVFGGGLGVTAVVTGSPVVTVNGGEVSGSVYGGGALANVTGNTLVNLLGGTIHDSYGGGLGSNEVAALVSGNATTTLKGSKVTGSIFGANNVNGTPEGHVKVHVLATSPRDGQTKGQFDVAAVYGGGNQAAYEPSQATFDANKGYTEVLIENCDNSIDYVYGGGNAAPVPATDVTIYGANAINNAFAGGNGAGDDNPGADVGYNGYYSQTAGETDTYGSGESHITVYGGTVNNVYGGSNTLGYIRTHAYVDIMTPPDNYGGASCPLHVGNTYAGGNQAAMFCGGSMTLACSEGADVVYAGANSADIYGNIDLVINSGTYGKVFGGNNESGNVYGHIKIDIDETGCYPIMIGELYGGGNKAAYSVYGYNDDGSVKTSGTKLYEDPTINIISFTGIGRVFGGGKGETAVVYGSPTININPIKGKFAGDNPQPLFVLNNNYERITNDRALNIPDAVGKIAAVYGGGNAAAVYGNTTVNIGNQAQNHHLTPGALNQPVDAIIAGNIYGGGSQADINGNTHVNIQIGTVLGDVFGGGEGVEGDADKAKVTGTTKVTIGE